jgi:hypothetical protein
MPLPRSKGNPDKDYWGYGLKDLDEAMPEELEDPEGELNFLGQGHAGGAAWTSVSDPNKVVKYTMDRSEMKGAEAVKKWQDEHGGKFHPSFVGVYEYDPVPDHRDLYRLVTEKVYTDWTEEEKLMFPYLQKPNDETGFGVEPWENAVRRVSGTMTYALEENQVIFKEMYKKFSKMQKSLKALGMYATDIHIGNLGKRKNGDYVILDLGFLF